MELKKMHFESLVVMTCDDLCHGGNSSYQLFLTPCFYAESCKAKISSLLRKRFRAEPRVWGQNEAQGSLQGNGAYGQLSEGVSPLSRR